MLRLSLPLILLLALVGCRSTPDYSRSLAEGAAALLPLGPDEPRPDLGPTWIERDELLPALDRSIDWTSRDYAEQFFPIAGITHGRALASLQRFRDLILESPGPTAFNEALHREFDVFKSAGWDGRGGGVLFTGYCTPILKGQMVPDAEHLHPLYALPHDLEKGPDGAILGQRTAIGLQPYPTRAVIEANHLLTGQGLELVWLADPLDAFLAHVNGSAFIEVEDGSLYRLGYAGKNGREYISLGRLLIEAGEIPFEEMSLAAIRRWAAEHPVELREYILQNESYVFFTPIDTTPRGSLNLEVTGFRTLATDKTLFPRGGLVFVDAGLPLAQGGDIEYQQLMLDQDTGGAIRTAGRADLYLGIGPEAEKLAGMTRAVGQMYYLFLRE